MSPLARDFYVYLAGLLAENADARVSYRLLVLHFRTARRLSWRGGPMHAALGEIVEWCRANDTRFVPAIVVRAKDGLPGDGFFVVAFPGVDVPDERRRLWENEVEALRGGGLPPPPPIA